MKKKTVSACTGCLFLSREEININRLLSFQNPNGLVGEPTQGLDFSFMLPAKARDKGIMLLDVTYRQPQYSGKDPFIIFDQRGKILHRWPDGYTPGWGEVQKVAQELT